MSPHTPGPWVVQSTPNASLSRYGHEYLHHAIIADHKGDALPDHACIATLVPYGETTEAAANEQAANARLVAAAPDLLETLRYAAMHAEDTETVRLASQAIAKAEGGRS